MGDDQETEQKPPKMTFPSVSDRGTLLFYCSHGFEYRRYRPDTSKQPQYRCTVKKCGALTTYDNAHGCLFTTKHNHMPRPELRELRSLRTKIKIDSSRGVPVKDIIENCVRKAPDELRPFVLENATRRMAQRTSNQKPSWIASIGGQRDDGQHAVESGVEDNSEECLFLTDYKPDRDELATIIVAQNGEVSTNLENTKFSRHEVDCNLPEDIKPDLEIQTSSKEENSSADFKKKPALSNKGRLIQFDEEGFSYRFNRINSQGYSTFRCTNKTCTAKGIILNGVFERYSEHKGHLPKDFEPEIRELRKKAVLMKKAGEPTKAIENLLNATDAALQARIKRASIIRAAQRAVEPKKFPSWPCPVDSTLFRHTFARFDNCGMFLEPSDGALKIFASDWAIQVLATNGRWFVDTKFHYAPLPFSKIITIGAQFEHLYIPCVYGYLCCIQPYTCTLFVEIFKDFVKSEPTNLEFDFEIEVVRAFAKAYPAATIGHGIYQFQQALNDELLSLRLTSVYNDANSKYNAIVALSMVPPSLVNNYYIAIREALMQNCAHHEKRVLDNFFKFFEREFIGTEDAAPIYSIPSWNVNQKVLKFESLGMSSFDNFNLRLPNIPSNGSISTALRLFSHDVSYQEKFQQADFQGKTITVLFPQQSRRHAIRTRRKALLLDSSYAGRPVEHLEALSSYIRDDIG